MSYHYLVDDICKQYARQLHAGEIPSATPVINKLRDPILLQTSRIFNLEADHERQIEAFREELQYYLSNYAQVDEFADYRGEFSLKHDTIFFFQHHVQCAHDTKYFILDLQEARNKIEDLNKVSSLKLAKDPQIQQLLSDTLERRYTTILKQTIQLYISDLKSGASTNSDHIDEFENDSQKLLKRCLEQIEDQESYLMEKKQQGQALSANDPDIDQLREDRNSLFDLLNN